MMELARTAIQIGAMAAVISYMFAQGLTTTAGDLRYFRERPGLLLRSLLAVDVVAPFITLLIVVFIRPGLATTLGLLVLAASPAAPLALAKISLVRGKREYATSLHLVLAVLSVITTPITLALLEYITGVGLRVSISAVAVQIGLTVVLPIMAGMVARRFFPAFSHRLAGLLETASIVVLVLLVIVVLASTYPLLMGLGTRSYFAMASTIAAALMAGHLIAMGFPDERTVLALESATRNLGLAILIASVFAPLENALSVLVPYVVISSILGAIYAGWRKRSRRAVARPAPERD